MRIILFTTGLFLVGLAATAADAQQSPPPVSPQAAEFFEKRIRPLLAEHCFSCHGAKKQQAGLRLDSASALLKGKEDGPVVVPGHPDKSLLIRAVRQEGDVQMPPKGKLPPQAIDDLTTWVQMGVPWPAGQGTPQPGNTAEAWKKHWAFQPVRAPALPAVKNQAWVKTPVDAFILAALEAKGLTPTPAADRRTLLRRASFDLLGLPPSAEEVAAFEADSSTDAFARVVERLLASPHYGERWGRHWLDVARYADTKGYVFREERRYPYSYTYRDYVIRAINEDLPFDQFIVQQLAADRVPSADRRTQAAMGFLTLGRRFLNNPHDIIDDRIDVVSRGLLGLTVACARCHDHKFDPIPQKDYYSLYGVFASSVEPKDLPLIGEPERTPEYLTFEKELKVREGAVAKFREAHKTELAAGNRKFLDELRDLQKKVDQWNATSTAAPPRAMVLQDQPTPRNARVFLRGNPTNRGPEVPRQFLQVLSGDKRQPFKDGSGRLELARAIASKDNPLTARVFVNRVWLHHFGAGLVRSPSNFGLRSDPPTHPELLDYLAWRFMEDGWSLKKLHRLILLSSTYQQGSTDSLPGSKADPENLLLWKMNRQRLDFESLRDALLSVSGKLDASVGGPPVELTGDPFTGRRTVYGFIDRQNLPGLFRTFDFASPDTTSPQRFLTTVPQQALFLMNSPFVIEQARLLLRRPEIADKGEPETRIQQLYRCVYGRPAERDEVSLGLKFVESAASPDPAAPPGAQALNAWERYAQVLLLSNEFIFVD